MTPDVPLRIGVVGASAADPDLAALASRLGAALARAGAVVVCGGLGGVMAAAARGAREAGGQVLGLLPGDDTGAGNPWLTLPLTTGMGEGRNVLVVRFSEALVAVGGSWGTLSEIALAQRMGRPVALLALPAAGTLGLPVYPDPEDAAGWALEQALARRESPHG